VAGLNTAQKRLIFDYCFGLTVGERTRKAESLIANNDTAAEIASCIKGATGPLQSINTKSCPDQLVERTISRLKKQDLASKY